VGSNPTPHSSFQYRQGKISLAFFFKEKRMAEEHRLTPEQIKNWRKVLCGMVGPYALIMPDEEVQKFRDKMQSAVHLIEPESSIDGGSEDEKQE
jgi:hypothetical protein